jgi:hypothetical protein
MDKRNAGDEVPGELAQQLTLKGHLVDLLAGAALCALAACFLVFAGQLEGPDHTGIGPATFPTGIAVLFAVCALMLVIRGGAGLFSGMPDLPVVIGRPLYVLAGMVLVAAFPLLMTKLGYYVATAILLPALLVVAGYRKPLGIALYSAGFLAFAKLAFEMALGVRLS